MKIVSKVNFILVYLRKLGDMSDMCMEERMLNRIISGLHAAINTNICENFERNGVNEPNHGFFFGAVGAFPERIENIYYFYSILLRFATYFIS